MKFVFGLVLLGFASIEAHMDPKIQIFEIREDGNNGLELRDLNSHPRTQQKVESQLLKLLHPKKQKRQKYGAVKKLIAKLKSLKGDEGNRIGDTAYVYTLLGSLGDSEKVSAEFNDETRLRSEQERLIKSLLEQLLKQNNKKSSPKRQDPALRSGGIIEDRTAAPRHRDYYDDRDY